MDKNPFVVFKTNSDPSRLYLQKSMKSKDSLFIADTIIKDLEDIVQNKQINSSKESSAKKLHYHPIYLSN